MIALVSETAKVLTARLAESATFRSALSERLTEHVAHGCLDDVRFLRLTFASTEASKKHTSRGLVERISAAWKSATLVSEKLKPPEIRWLSVVGVVVGW